MKKKIFTLIIMTTMILSLAACGKQEDTGIIVSVGDENNDYGLNDMTTETNDKETDEVVSTEDSKEDTNKKSDEYIDYITSGFVTENGDIYQFNVDGTYSCYLVETDISSYGIYETDGKSYMTLKCTGDNSGDDSSVEDSITEDESTTENNEVAYTTEELQEDGTVLVTEYDETDNVINQYTREEVQETDTEKEDSNGEASDNVIYEITYKLTRTTTTDEYDNTIEVVILSKGDTKIVLQKQFELQ